MVLRYSLFIQPDEKGSFFSAYCPALVAFGACTAGGTTFQEAVKSGQEAVDDFVTSLQEEGISVPPAEAAPEARLVNADCDVRFYEAYVRTVSLRACAS